MERKPNETEKIIKDRISAYINYEMEKDKSEATFHSFYGFYVSHFGKICDKSRLAECLAEELFNADKDVKSEFMNEFDMYFSDDSVRVCDHCGKFIIEGYYLAGEYACSDECAIELYPDDMSFEERKEQFEADLSGDEANCWGECYWTEW